MVHLPLHGTLLLHISLLSLLIHIHFHNHDLNRYNSVPHPPQTTHPQHPAEDRAPIHHPTQTRPIHHLLHFTTNLRPPRYFLSATEGARSTAGSENPISCSCRSEYPSLRSSFTCIFSDSTIFFHVCVCVCVCVRAYMVMRALV